jgi:DinB superfamily
MSEDLRYPIGPFTLPDRVTDGERAGMLEQVAEAPRLMRAAVAGLGERQLDTPYRPGGWTVRQVVHHVPDSHMGAYTRFKLALTETVPVIKPYEEARWAELADTPGTPVETSLRLLELLHERWLVLLRTLGPGEWGRGYFHPERGRVLRLDQTLALYAWHGRHHAAHVTGLRRREGWG